MLIGQILCNRKIWCNMELIYKNKKIRKMQEYGVLYIK
jgi:hypothetical protein